MPELAYRDFIKEAYIDPIRSVLIVDDDYPTLEEVLLEKINIQPEVTVGRTKLWKTDAGRFKEVISELRQKNWMVDTHDGVKVLDEGGVAQHLHQSDLLILDYQLDGDGGDGKKCLSVIQELARNNHYNLIVLYTQQQAEEVFYTVIRSLLAPCSYIESKAGVSTVIAEKIEQWEDEDADIVSKLLESIDLGLYLAVRQNIEKCLGEINKEGGGGRFHRFISLHENAPAGTAIDKTKLFFWVIQKKQEEWMAQFSISSFPECRWSDDSSRVPWVRTDKLFLTVVSKSERIDLPEALLDALEEWAPSPSRLILSKIRSQIEDLGVSAEDVLLQNNIALQAGWYESLLKAEEKSVATEIEETITRHWDGLITILSSDVGCFVQKLLEFERKGGRTPDKIVSERYEFEISGPANREKALLHQNAYNCSKKPGGWHLTTGHILKLGKDEFRICLSPACDLVPGQKSDKGRYAKLDPLLPFHAVRLYSYKSNQALKEVNYGRCVFVNLAGKIEAFSLMDCSVPQENRDEANPAWEEFFVENQGVFPPNSEMKITIHRSAWCDSTGRIETKKEEAQIVGQLRYEYALNLLQRHGAALSRVGLGFIGLPQKDKAKESS